MQLLEPGRYTWLLKALYGLLMLLPQVSLLYLKIQAQLFCVFLLELHSFMFNLSRDTLMQQSAAFKILRTRLKTVPSFSFNGEQIKRTSSGNPYSQILHSMPSGSQFSEDGDVNSDAGSSHGGINFASRLQQFEQMQHQHRIHGKAQAQLRSSSTSSSKVNGSPCSCYFYFC